MRWSLIPLVLLLAGATAKETCLISDFYGLAWTLHNPSERHQRLSQWITVNGDSCNSGQLVVIWNNLSEWAGVADSAELRSKVLYYYARAVEREKK
jgi:hypothetical protein